MVQKQDNIKEAKAGVNVLLRGGTLSEQVALGRSLIPSAHTVPFISSSVFMESLDQILKSKGLV